MDDKKEATDIKDAPAAEANEAGTAVKGKTRRKFLMPLVLCAAVVVVAGIFGIRALVTPASLTEITDKTTPLADLGSVKPIEQILEENPDAVANNDGTVTLADGTVVNSGDAAADGGNDNGSGAGATTNDGSTAGGSNGSTNAGNSTGGDNTGGGGSSTGSGQTWHEGYNEQVWVDTSHWETQVLRPAYDEPVMEDRTFCSDCGADITGMIMEHINTVHGGISSGWYNKYVQVGSIHHDAITQDTWVTGGYWATVWHDGYWG